MDTLTLSCPQFFLCLHPGVHQQGPFSSYMFLRGLYALVTRVFSPFLDCGDHHSTQLDI